MNKGFVNRRTFGLAAAAAGLSGSLGFAPTTQASETANEMEIAMKSYPINPSDTMILFADLQNGIVEFSGTNELANLRKAVSALAKLAKAFNIPALVTTAPPQQGAPEVLPEIAAALGELPSHTRKTTDAFTDAPTRGAILALNRKALLIAGVATEIIVQHSALSAVSSGMTVYVVVDACGGISARTENAALSRLVQAGVIPTSIASLAGQLAGDFTQGKGGEALRIFYEMNSK